MSPTSRLTMAALVLGLALLAAAAWAVLSAVGGHIAGAALRDAADRGRLPSAAVIGWSAQLASKRAPRGEAPDESLDNVPDATRRASGLIASLLVFGRQGPIVGTANPGVRTA